MLHQQTIRFVNNRILPLHSPHRPHVYRKLSPYCCHFCATYYKYFFHIHFLAQSMPYFVHFKHTRQINSVETPLKTQFVAAKLNHACWSLSNGGQSRIQFHFRLHYFIWKRYPVLFPDQWAAHVASRILVAILLASKNGGFDRVLLGSSLQKLDYQ